jgi:hypothetical protein
MGERKWHFVGEMQRLIGSDATALRKRCDALAGEM